MSEPVRIDAGFIVEGHGDVDAVPVVFRRIVSLLYPSALVLIPTPFRIPKDKLKRSGELERTVEFVSRRLNRRGLILITVDTTTICLVFLDPNCATGRRRRIPICGSA